MALWGTWLYEAYVYEDMAGFCPSLLKMQGKGFCYCEVRSAACALPLTVCVHVQLLFFFDGFLFPIMILFLIKRSVF